MKMRDLLWRLPSYWLARRISRWPFLGWSLTSPLPMNLTLSLSYRCNSRCATCNVWQREADEIDEMTVDEWERVFRALGTVPYWITVSGGEPLLRLDAVRIIQMACRICQPAILNIPTNGLLPDRIVGAVEQLTATHPEVQFVLNLSLDGWGEAHDRIRGVAGNFERATETYRRLQALKASGRSNLTVGIHTVISRYNTEAVPALYTQVQENWSPDSYITEIAEERVELGTVGSQITPDAALYAETIEQVMRLQDRHPSNGLGRVTWAFRRRYYRLVERWLRERRQVIPCYAGWASAQIAPDGEVWFCCIRAESVGNLRQADYDFRRVWRSKRAQALRVDVRAGRCSCPLANAAYTNLLLYPPAVLGVARDLWSGGDGRK